MISRRLPLMLAVLVLGITTQSCYHATITTGLTPGTQTIEQPWATGWVFGLVPPQTVEAASQCPNGVAQVETQLSFLNQLVSGITFGIFTPMSIKVTCAATSSDAGQLNPGISIPSGAQQAEVLDAFEQAGNEAAESGETVIVLFK